MMRSIFLTLLVGLSIPGVALAQDQAITVTPLAPTTPTTAVEPAPSKAQQGPMAWLKPVARPLAVVSGVVAAGALVGAAALWTTSPGNTPVVLPFVVDDRLWMAGQVAGVVTAGVAAVCALAWMFVATR